MQVTEAEKLDRALRRINRALNEYADAPHEVTAWVDALMMCEGV